MPEKITILEITPRQQRVLRRWLKSLDQQELAEQADEDCVVTSPLTWEFWNTGLGPEIRVHCLRETLNLSIDDDNIGCWPEEFGEKER